MTDWQRARLRRRAIHRDRRACVVLHFHAVHADASKGGDRSDDARAAEAVVIRGRRISTRLRWRDAGAAEPVGFRWRRLVSRRLVRTACAADSIALTGIRRDGGAVAKRE